MSNLAQESTYKISKSLDNELRIISRIIEAVKSTRSEKLQNELLAVVDELIENQELLREGLKGVAEVNTGRGN